ncbi:MAG: helix-turn-helix transcriptional regulator [Clostridiales bacterium]|nr:helix-turn-helix transcriptional regulator [Clostridiales bacterium]
MIEITSIRHHWPEKAGFTLTRPNGHEHYTFLHFYNSVEVKLHNVTITTKPHACLMYAPGVPQYFHSEQPLLHDWFHSRGEDLENLFSCNTLYYPASAGFITAMAQEMEAEFNDDRYQRCVLLDSKVKELLIRITRAENSASISYDTAHHEECFRKLRAHIFTHLDETWTINRMADLVHLSPSRFFTIYRALYGKSPTDDLISARIDAAKIALAFGEQSLTAIAEGLGYRYLTHFMRQFHDRTGETPTAYRRRHMQS